MDKPKSAFAPGGVSVRRREDVPGPRRELPPVEKSFGSTFAEQRRAGAKEFTWRGEKYSTQTREEAAPRQNATPARPAPARQASTPARPAPARQATTPARRADPTPAPRQNTSPQISRVRQGEDAPRMQQPNNVGRSPARQANRERIAHRIAEDARRNPKIY